MPTWNPEQYLRFADERTRPCRDLLARLNIVAPQRVVDLGCGPGNSTAVLVERWPKAEVLGVDNSAEMIDAARQKYPHVQWTCQDIAQWAAAEADASFSVIFSNAALQWLPNHQDLYPLLFSKVKSGGVLAVQVPGNMHAPAHHSMRELAASTAWRSAFSTAGVREWHVLDLPTYYDLLATTASQIDIWETEYLHVLPSAEAIVDWYKGTGLRPFLDALATQDQREQFTREYLACIRDAYPPQQNGQILFPFRRLFLIATK